MPGSSEIHAPAPAGPGALGREPGREFPRLGVFLGSFGGSTRGESAVFASFTTPPTTAPPMKYSGRAESAEATEASRKINDLQTRRRTEADRGGRLPRLPRLRLGLVRKK